MPAYSFQEKFVKKILDGYKLHTIRRRRKRPTKPGDILKMFVGMRTKTCYQFAEVPCLETRPCIIFPYEKKMLICVLKGRRKSKKDNHLYRYAAGFELETIAKYDGFETVEEMFEFFKIYKKERLEDFEIIYWDCKKIQPKPINAKVIISVVR